jgi:predicted TIM-barrel fold metal-dependent hydrolase
MSRVDDKDQGSDQAGQPFVVVSADCHAGARWADYRPYVDPTYREDFDGWLAAIEARHELVGGTAVDIRGETIRQAVEAEPAVQEGGIEGAWDPDIRRRELDRDGVAGEVVFPDGINQNSPPFDARGILEPAADRYDAQLRMAGARAYNRWLAELCNAGPGRHAGIAIVPFDDVETAVAEVETARATGLFGGILVPAVPLTTNDPEWLIHHPRFEPIWAACAALEMPLNIHSGGSGVNYGELPGSRWIHTTEAYWTSRRPLWQLMWAGVLERYPTLKVAMAEVLGGWAVFDLQYWEYIYDARNPEIIRESLPLRPSEYWARQCFIGASPPAGRFEVENRYALGVGNLMWGSDYPHPDGTWPNSRARIAEMLAAVPEDEAREILGTNALGVYDFDRARLRQLADQIGPRPDDLYARPVAWDQPHKLAYVAGVTTSTS